MRDPEICEDEDQRQLREEVMFHLSDRFARHIADVALRNTAASRRGPRTIRLEVLLQFAWSRLAVDLGYVEAGAALVALYQLLMDSAMVRAHGIVTPDTGRAMVAAAGPLPDDDPAQIPIEFDWDQIPHLYSRR